MSTKSAQKHDGGRVPFQARHKVIVVTVIILLLGWVAWNFAYTKAVGTAPLGAPATVITPGEVNR